MNRRELLRKSVIASLGLSLSPALLMSLESCSRKRPTADVPVYLEQEEFDSIWQIAELVLPKTDSPGADDAKVTPFIDQLFGKFFEEDVKATYLNGLTTFLKNCKNQKGKSFLNLPREEQTDYLEFVDQDEDKTSFFRSFKTIILWNKLLLSVVLKAIWDCGSAKC